MSHRITLMLILLLTWAGIAPAQSPEVTSKTVSMAQNQPDWTARFLADLRETEGAYGPNSPFGVLHRTDDPVIWESAREALLTYFPEANDTARFRMFFHLGKVFPKEQGPYEGRLKELILSVIRRHDRSNPSRLTYEAIGFVGRLRLSPEEFDELLSMTLTIDHAPGERDRFVPRVGRDHSRQYRLGLLVALAQTGGPNSFVRIKEHIEREDARPIRLVGRTDRNAVFLRTRHPDALRLLLETCQTEITKESPENHFQFLFGVLAGSHFPPSEEEKTTALELLRGAVLNSHGTMPEDIRVDLLKRIQYSMDSRSDWMKWPESEKKQKQAELVDEYARIAEDARAFWSNPAVARELPAPMETTLAEWRARGAASAPGASGS